MFDYSDEVYPKKDIVRTQAYYDIGNLLLSVALPAGNHPIFEYGPSNGIIRSGLDVNRPFVVRNWPEVDCMRCDYPKNSFSVIIADYTLEHVGKPWLTAQSSYDMLVSGGFAIYTTHWMFPDHTGIQEEDYYRYSPKGLRTLFDMFPIIVTGCWGNGHLAGKFIELNAMGQEKCYRECFPEMSLEEILSAKDRLYAITTWIVAQKG